MINILPPFRNLSVGNFAIEIAYLMFASNHYLNYIGGYVLCGNIKLN